jgi:hypothetical protein
VRRGKGLSLLRAALEHGRDDETLSDFEARTASNKGASTARRRLKVEGTLKENPGESSKDDEAVNASRGLMAQQFLQHMCQGERRIRSGKYVELCHRSASEKEHHPASMPGRAEACLMASYLFQLA